MDKATAVNVTVNTPGWEIIENMITASVDKARLAALANNDETKVIELWRRAQVADALFFALRQDIENLLETLPARD